VIGEITEEAEFSRVAVDLAGDSTPSATSVSNVAIVTHRRIIVAKMGLLAGSSVTQLFLYNSIVGSRVIEDPVDLFGPHYAVSMRTTARTVSRDGESLFRGPRVKMWPSPRVLIGGHPSVGSDCLACYWRTSKLIGGT
jgi:hypothetical protein